MSFLLININILYLLIITLSRLGKQLADSGALHQQTEIEATRRIARINDELLITIDDYDQMIADKATLLTRVRYILMYGVVMMCGLAPSMVMIKCIMIADKANLLTRARYLLM